MKSQPEPRSGRPWGCIVVTALIVVVGAWLWFQLKPSDEVEIRVRGLPSDTEYACIVADLTTGPTGMTWYVHKIDAVRVAPDACVVGNLDGPTDLTATVGWVDGRRVGILRRSRDDRWQVAWFDAERSRPVGRRWIIGGGTWTAGWSEAASVDAVSAETLRSLGFQSICRSSRNRLGRDLEAKRHGKA